jgi:hypothetical protein
MSSMRGSYGREANCQSPVRLYGLTLISAMKLLLIEDDASLQSTLVRTLGRRDGRSTAVLTVLRH